MRLNSFAGMVALVAGCALTGPPAWAHDPLQRERIVSRYDFAMTVARLEAAVAQNKLGLVSRANAQNGARSLGAAIPGNQVWGLFAPRYGVRMLNASVDAGIEAPIRLYIVESPNGPTRVSYLKPSAVFAPYHSPELDALAVELDRLFERIVAEVR
jgi:uncharacterized protein (DUF302 family)